MFSGRLNATFGSLRSRLTWWNTLVFVFMMAGLLWGVREIFRVLLLRELDAFLGEETMAISLDLEQAGPRVADVHAEIERKSQGHREHGWFVQFLEPNGLPQWSSEATPLMMRSIPSSAVGTAPQAYSLGPFRCVEALFRPKDAPPKIIRVGSTTASIDQDLTMVTRAFGVTALLIVLVAPIGGYLLARRAIAPLAQIIRSTAKMQPEELSQRLAIQGTGDELDQLSLTINGLLDRLSHFVRRKRDFIANAAHELRSPLTAIQSSVEVALNSDRTTSEYKDLLVEIAEECGSLTQLVSQLLLLAETTSGAVVGDVEPVRLDLIVDKSIDMFRGAAEYRAIELRLDSPGEVWVAGHRQHLRQVVNNLVDNALKFTPSGGVVSVRLTIEAKFARLTVEDTGKGISEEDLPFLFERFYRGDKARQREQEGGNGLGLAICQSIVTAYQGTIELSSQLGRGTTVVVRWPIVPRPSLVAQANGDRETSPPAGVAQGPASTLTIG